MLLNICLNPPINGTYGGGGSSTINNIIRCYHLSVITSIPFCWANDITQYDNEIVFY